MQPNRPIYYEFLNHLKIYHLTLLILPIVIIIAIIIKASSTNQQTLKSLPNFQIKYRNPDKLRISQLLAKIQLNKLSTLKLQQNKQNNLTEYKKTLNIIYYHESDLKHIKNFLSETTDGYVVKKLRGGYLNRYNKNQKENK